MSAPHSYESEAALPEQGDIEVGEMDLTVGAKQGRRRRLTTEAARRRAAHATSALAGDISLDVEVGSSEQGDGRDDDEDDYYYDDEDDYVQDDDDDREHGEHWDELGGTYEVPEGQRESTCCSVSNWEKPVHALTVGVLSPAGYCSGCVSHHTVLSCSNLWLTLKRW